MKVLITGGLGWLGKALSEQVSTRHRVCAFDLERPDVERERSEFEGDVLYGSVTEYSDVEAAVEGQDAVIHAAVASTVTRGQYVDVTDTVPFDVNLRGTCNVLEAMRRHGVARFIQIASAETHVEHPAGTFLDDGATYFGRPSYYDLTKCLQEQICQWFAYHYELDITLLRLGDIVDTAQGRSKHGEHSWDASMATDSWIDRYDVGKACLQLLEQSNAGVRIYHLVGAPAARERFDIDRTTAALQLSLTTEIDKRPASRRA